FFTDCQADAGARILLAGVEALEDHENPFKVLWFDPDAVVADTKHPFGRRRLIVALRRDGDSGRVAAELGRVADQVLKQLHQLDRIAHYFGQRRVGDLDAALFDGDLQVRERLGQDFAAVAHLKRFAARAQPGVGQQVRDQALHAQRAVHGVANELVR